MRNRFLKGKHGLRVAVLNWWAWAVRGIDSDSMGTKKPFSGQASSQSTSPSFALGARRTSRYSPRPLHMMYGGLDSLRRVDDALGLLYFLCRAVSNQ